MCSSLVFSIQCNLGSILVAPVFHKHSTQYSFSCSPVTNLFSVQLSISASIYQCTSYYIYQCTSIVNFRPLILFRFCPAQIPPPLGSSTRVYQYVLKNMIPTPHKEHLSLVSSSHLYSAFPNALYICYDWSFIHNHAILLWKRDNHQRCLPDPLTTTTFINIHTLTYNVSSRLEHVSSLYQGSRLVHQNI